MTIKELKEKIANLPDELEVGIPGYDGDSIIASKAEMKFRNFSGKDYRGIDIYDTYETCLKGRLCANVCTCKLILEIE